MTHTEESLMALADDYHYANINNRYKREKALRLAIREVLAERDTLKQSDYERVSLANGIDDLLLRAEKAEAECERLRELIAELDGHEGAEGWSEGMRERIDAALKEQPCQS